MDVSEVLLFEGLPPFGRRGGRNLFGRTCIRRKRVYSPVLGRNVERCAQFSGGGMAGLPGLGAFPIDLSQIKDTLLTGALAVGGAAVSQKAVAYLAPMIKLDPESKYGNALEVVLGIGAGFLVGKYAGKPDLGAAIAVGPIVWNGMKMLGYFVTPPAAAAPEAISGYDRGLGVPVQPDQFPPSWMYESPYMQQVVGQQAPAFVAA